ncbi:MAG: DNA-protecting protein DprA, partial [Verrucomicrobia bacterium]|nr:DNA-protecting protein DprA [Verrucomicrobiota bacterium]
MTRREALIVLNMLPNLGPVRLRRLLEVFPSPEKVLQATKNDLRDVQGLNTPVIESLARWESLVDLPRELAKVREFGADILTLDDDLYPPLLKEIHDPPTILYVWGTLDKKDHHSIAVVGSRRTSHYGLECAKKLSYQIAYSGLTVISGLARGIDTAAHQGALAAKGRTLAV